MDAVDPVVDVPVVHRRRPAARWILRIGLAGLALVLFGVLLWFAGVELATPDGTGYASHLDLTVARWFAANRDTAMVWLAEAIGVVTGTVGVLVGAVLAGVWLFREVGRRVVVWVPLAAVVVAGMLDYIVKVSVVRPRPDAALRAVVDTGFSFPSAHAATTAALAVSVVVVAARAVGPRTPRWLVPAVVAIAVVASVSRLVLGVHWITDVLAGVVTGVVVALVIVVALMPVPRTERPRSRRRVGLTVPQRLAVLPLVAVLAAVGSSYVSALRAPGYATIDVRTVDWLKGHGFTSVVDRAEAWWLWKHPPSTKDTLRSLPAPPVPSERRPPAAPSPQVGAAAPTAPTSSPGPSPVPPILSPALPGEGQWTTEQAAPDGRIEIATTRVRPDPAHPDLTVSLAWMDPATVRFMVIAGTRQPGGGSGPAGAQVPVDLQSQLLAAFNSGYKMRDTPGGALEEGHTAGTLQDGIASFVVHTDGSATVAMWGRDAQLGPDVTEVRQNLHLIIDGGAVVPGLRHNVGGLWGGIRSTLPTWRSAVGVDAQGHVLYASGNQLTLDVLAEALHAAGAVRAMELDIHKKMVVFNLFTHPGGQAAPVGHRLSPDMPTPANRYLVPDQRDFVAVFSR